MRADTESGVISFPGTIQKIGNDSTPHNNFPCDERARAYSTAVISYGKTEKENPGVRVIILCRTNPIQPHALPLSLFLSVGPAWSYNGDNP